MVLGVVALVAVVVVVVVVVLWLAAEGVVEAEAG